MSDRLLRLLVITATDGFVRSLSLNGPAVRALELNRHLAEGKHRVEVSMLLYDINRDSAPTDSWPFPVHYLTHEDYYDPKHGQLKRLVRKAQPHVLVISDSSLLVRSGRQLADAAGCALVYEMHAQERVPALSSVGAAGGMHDGVVQGEALRLADAVVAFTGDDAQHAIDAGAGQVMHLPCGAVPRRAAAGGNPRGPVVVAADFTQASNAQALATLNSCLPEDMPVAVYGRYPAPMRTLLPRLTLHGPVPNLPAALAQGSVGIAAHSEPSGMRAQILSYMAAGLPVIATRQAATGLETTGAMLISDEPDMADLPELLARLRKDPELCRALGLHGHRRIEQMLSWARIAERAASAYRSVRPERAGLKASAGARMLSARPPGWLTLHPGPGRARPAGHVAAGPDAMGDAAVDCARMGASCRLGVHFPPQVSSFEGGRATFTVPRAALTVFFRWPRQTAERTIEGLQTAASCGHITVPRVTGRADFPGSASWVSLTPVSGTPLSDIGDAAAVARLLGSTAGYLHRLPEEMWAGVPRLSRSRMSLETARRPDRLRLLSVLRRSGHHRNGCGMSFVHGNLHGATVLVGPDPASRPVVTDFSSCGVGCPDEDLAVLYVHHAADGHWGEIWSAYQEVCDRAVDLTHVAWHGAHYVRWALQDDQPAHLVEKATTALPGLLGYLTDDAALLDRT
ncbi:glycosyltransferase [Streptomyces abikoensis]